jgi:hypothetical protein
MPATDTANGRIIGFKGINNRLDPTALGWQWQLQAENLLCSDAGHLVSRPGYTSLFGGVVDAFQPPGQPLLVVTSDNTLQELHEDGSIRTRATGLIGAPFEWATLGYATFALSATSAWAIYPDRVVSWGVPALPAPSVIITAGEFLSGTYLVATILVAADGRVGGCTGVTSVNLNHQGITVSAPSLDGYITRAYLSAPDGIDLYAAGDLVNGVVTLSDRPSAGQRLLSMQCAPPPFGGMIARHGNRMAVAIWEPQWDRSVLYWSQPDAPHWFTLDTDYQVIAGRVTLLAAIPGGLFVGTDRALWAIDAMGSAQSIAPIGAISNTLDYQDDGSIVFWTARGLAAYPPLKLFTDAALSPNNRVFAAGGILEHGGSRYYIADMQGRNAFNSQRSPYVPLNVNILPVR